jgi:hypothetical protein
VNQPLSSSSRRIDNQRNWRQPVNAETTEADSVVIQTEVSRDLALNVNLTNIECPTPELCISTGRIRSNLPKWTPSLHSPFRVMDANTHFIQTSSIPMGSATRSNLKHNLRKWMHNLSVDQASPNINVNSWSWHQQRLNINIVRARFGSSTAYNSPD